MEQSTSCKPEAVINLNTPEELEEFALLLDYALKGAGIIAFDIVGKYRNLISSQLKQKNDDGGIHKA